MNLFAMKLEDTEGLRYPEGVEILEGEDSVQAAVLEATVEEAGLVEDEEAQEQLITDEEDLTEVERVADEVAPTMEHSGLTPINARLANLVLSNILGKKHVERHVMPRFEHFDSRANARDSTKLVAESVGGALKSFWEAVKAQFKKIWTKMKTWYVKTFSSAKALNARAIKVRDRAEGMSTTMDKKSFPFAQVKELSIGGKLKGNESAFKTALELLANIVKATHETPTDKMIDDISDMVDIEAANNRSVSGDGQTVSLSSTKAADVSKQIIDKFQQRLDSLLKPDTGKNFDPNTEKKLIESLGGGADGVKNLKRSEVLPGDKYFVVTSASDTNDALAKLRNARATLANTKDKPKEISADAEASTLTVSNISSYCNTIIDSTSDIFDYEKEWVRVDRQQEAFLRKLDEVVKDKESDIKDNDDDDKQNAKLSELRTMASTTTNFVKAVASVPNMTSTYAMRVYSATLNWCEASMRNYK